MIGQTFSHYRVLEKLSEGGVDFIAMEYVAGKTLEQLMDFGLAKLTEPRGPEARLRGSPLVAN